MTDGIMIKVKGPSKSEIEDAEYFLRIAKEGCKVDAPGACEFIEDIMWSADDD